MLLARTLLLFFVTACTEIAGCYLPYLWLRRDGSPLLLLPASGSLAAFAWLLTLHPAAAGRTYAAYGGVYITAAMGFPAPAASSRFWSAEQGGGALLDLGVYVITFAEMFLAEAGDVTVSSVLGRIREDGVDIRALVTLAAGEATAQLATSIDHTVVPAASIAGTSGSPAANFVISASSNSASTLPKR